MDPVLVFVIIAALIHIIACVVIFILIKIRVMKISIQLFPIILFVPVWGFIMSLTAEWTTRRHKTGSKSIQLEDLHAIDGDYRTLQVESEDTLRNVVPLEEAILINDTDTRRKLMIEILHQDPGQYIQLLQQARLNDDIEVTHYASTAIMELQRDYELELQRCEKILSQNPEDVKALSDCILALRKYIDSGLIEDSILLIQRTRYSALLEEKIKFTPDERRSYYELADNYMELEDFIRAEKLINIILKKWADDENAWFLRLKYAKKTNDGELLQKTVEDIKKNNVYLSSHGKSTLSFWSRSFGEEY